MRKTIAERFWPKVDKDGPVPEHRPDLGPCWMWGGTRHYQGYGMIHRDGAMVYAHRVGYELERGPIPTGLDLDHLCRNHACVNPAHLDPVTRQTNLMRGDTEAARNARKTHCDHGHEFTPENTYTQPSGRGCRACRKRRSREHELRKKEVLR